MMRHRIAVLSVLAVLAIPAASFLSHPVLAAGDITVTGEVLDMACYIGHGAHGPEHKKCAEKCAQMGQPLGLLSADGKVYLLVADHTDQAPYQKVRTKAGDQVTITGESETKDGITTLSVKGLK
jgi:hypothetical protein